MEDRLKVLENSDHPKRPMSVSSMPSTLFANMVKGTVKRNASESDIEYLGAVAATLSPSRTSPSNPSKKRQKDNHKRLEENFESQVVLQKAKMFPESEHEEEKEHCAEILRSVDSTVTRHEIKFPTRFPDIDGTGEQRPAIAHMKCPV